MTLGRALVLLLALLPAGVTYYFWSNYEGQNIIVNERAPETNPSLPKIYMLDADTLRFSSEGSISSRILSPEVETFGASEEIYLTTPEIVAHVDDSIAWRAKGETGIMNHAQQRVSLLGDVQFRETPSKHAYAIDAIELTFDVDEQKITSDQRVNITTDKHEITSVGMIVDLEARQISLLSNVEGQHEPLR